MKMDAKRPARLKWFTKQILGKDIDMDSFDEKLVIQKAVHISEHLGIEWGYEFGWYVRGMYSSTLTVDLYGLWNKDPEYTPTETDQTILAKIKPLENILEGMPMHSKPKDAYELVSTVIRAKRERGMKTEEEIKNYIGQVKPWYTTEHVERAIKYVEGLN
jgi:uncharacterized protein YwgA